MKKEKILSKKDGVLKEYERSILLSNKTYLDEDEKCFKDILGSIEKNDNKTVLMVSRDVSKIITYILNRHHNKDIKEVFEVIKNAKNKDDLITACNVLKDAYIKIYKENNEEIQANAIPFFNKDLEKFPNLTISTLIKKIVIRYYENALLENKEKCVLLYEEKSNGAKIDDLLESFEGKMDKNAVNCGIQELSKKAFNDKLNQIYDFCMMHMCWNDCKNASPLKCRKFLYKWEPINKYEEISSGYQIIKGRKIETFIVLECDNYVKDMGPTKEEKENGEIAKAALKTIYYDAIDENEEKEIEEKEHYQYFIKKHTKPL